ncbi:RNA polymerase sigma factor [Spirillospora sp. CA-294931]|uniref:RNA polymerase sigma factor n=1 Tax=Spirillospora sp. CA-294931 TaxID=3240042 RepID=UPI003D8EE528
MTDSPSGDASFEKLFHAQQRRLLGYLIGMSGDFHVAEDILNQSFLVVWRQWHRPEIKSGSPIPYLFKVARHLMVRTLDQRRYIPQPEADSTEDLADTAEPAEETALLRKQLQWALSHLSPREREAIILRYYLGYGCSMTAQIMSSKTTPISVGAVKRYAADGRRKLRALLDQQHFDDEGGTQ